MWIEPTERLCPDRTRCLVERPVRCDDRTGASGRDAGEATVRPKAPKGDILGSASLPEALEHIDSKVGALIIVS